MLSPPLPFPSVKSPPCNCVMRPKIIIVEHKTNHQKSNLSSCTLIETHHEVRNDPVKNTSFVMQRLAPLSGSLLSGTEGAEILHSLWNGVTVEAEGDSSSFTSFNVLCNLRSVSRGCEKLNMNMLRRNDHLYLQYRRRLCGSPWLHL
jgi:hypothetical protein